MKSNPQIGYNTGLSLYGQSSKSYAPDETVEYKVQVHVSNNFVYAGNNLGIQLLPMFELDLDEYSAQPYPKTHINFYTHINASCLQPWNKTTYVLKTHTKKACTLDAPRTRINSFNSNDSLTKATRKRVSEASKQLIPLSNMTLDVQSQAGQDCIKKRRSVSPVLRNRRLLSHDEQISRKVSEDFLQGLANLNKGFTKSLRHTNLLKLKQEHQNKVKQNLNRKQITNKGNYAKIAYRKHSLLQKTFNAKQIDLLKGDLPVPKSYEQVRKPRKPYYVGIRKLMSLTQGQKNN